MATQIDYQVQLNHFKKKRNLFLFFIIIPLFIVALLYLLNLRFVFISRSITDTLLLMMALFYLGYISYLKTRLAVVSMYYEYYAMLTNQIGPQTLKDELNYDLLKKLLIEKGYSLKQNHDKFSVYQLTKIDDKSYYHNKNTVVMAILLEGSDDLYDVKIQESLDDLYLDLEKKGIHVLNQVNFIYKIYDEFNQDSIENLDKIVTVKQGYRSLIQINVGLDLKNHQMYYLAPIKRYPNRMYFEAVKEIKRMNLS